MPEFFRAEEYTVSICAKGDKNVSNATVSVTVGGEKRQESAEGPDGPVDALDIALRKVLSKFYPEIDNVTLTDYKVRVLNSEEATKATVRVLITSSDGFRNWTTVGVSTNVIDASWHALLDGTEYYLSDKRK